MMIPKIVADGDTPVSNTSGGGGGGGSGGGGAAREEGGGSAGEEERRRFWRSEYNANEFASVRRASERVTLNLR